MNTDNAYISNDSYNAIDNNSKLNNQLEVLSDAIIMRCCQCCGYSTQSKYALRDVNKCIDNNCALFVVKQQAMFLLYNFPNIK